jgi:hypothetical protein
LLNGGREGGREGGMDGWMDGWKPFKYFMLLYYNILFPKHYQI